MGVWATFFIWLLNKWLQYKYFTKQIRWFLFWVIVSGWCKVHWSHLNVFYFCHWKLERRLWLWLYTWMCTYYIPGYIPWYDSCTVWESPTNICFSVTSLSTIQDYLKVTPPLLIIRCSMRDVGHFINIVL